MSKPPIALAYERAECLSSWPSPDLAIINAGRATPPTFPNALFGRLWPVAIDLAEGAGSPVDYVGLSILAVAASLIGGKRRVRPFEAGTWEEPCILWCGNVGEPSSNKSPGTDAAVSPLRPIEQAYAADHKLVVQQYRTQCERAKHERRAWEEQVKEATKLGHETPPMPDAAVEPECPERRRLLVQDSTPEALGSILAANPQGTLHLRDELAGWFQSFERYNAGGREFWLEAYGGRPHTIDRKNSEIPLRIPFNGVSVVGGIQPDKLVDLFQSGPDDGLSARFLWAWPDPIPFRRPRSTPDVAALHQAYARLESLRFGCDEHGVQVPICLRLNDGAADIFEAWAGENSAALVDAASLFKSFLGKARGTVLRLALVSELLNWAAEDRAEPVEVSPTSVVAAIEFFESYAVPSALRVLGDAARPKAERNAAVIARYIMRHKLQMINARDVRRSLKATIKDSADMEAALAELQDAGWVRPAPSRAGGSAGRQSKNFDVNPAVHGAAHG